MPFPWEQAIQAGLQIGSSAAAQHAAGAQSSAQKKQLGAQFDSLAGQVTQAFNRTEAQTQISTADFQALLALYQQLAAIDAQYGDAVPYVREQWNNPNYKQAYEQRLNTIYARVNSSLPANATATQTAASATAATAAALVPGVSNAILILGAGLILIFVLKGR